MQAVVFDMNGTLFELYDADGQQLDQAAGILDAAKLAATFNLTPGVDELLPILRRMGIKIGALTDDTEQAAAYLDGAGIRKYFDAVISAEQASKPLPHPESLHLALEELHVKPAGTVLVGGTKLGLKTGKNAGVAKTIALARSEDLRDMLQGIEPDELIYDIPSLLDVLE